MFCPPGNLQALEAASEGDKIAADRGIIPRAIEDIFSHIESDQSTNTKYLVRASFLQIYNEVISDLLKPERSNLCIREDKRRGLFVEGLSEWIVRTPAEIYSLMERGAAQRATGSTKLNEISSRSHAVFQIIVENAATEDDESNADVAQCDADGQPDSNDTTASESADGSSQRHNLRRRRLRIGKLNLVDLAGSERVRVSRATGKRLEESKKINQSLSSLGNVISALTDSKCRTHIPYRDSKLTRILEDSLGGNCKTTMFAMVSPAVDSFGESLSTLKFANRAKHIKNNARINEDLDQKSLLRRYERELKELRSELQERQKHLVDKRKLLEVEEQRRQAEEDKVKAVTELEQRSQEFMREKDEKKHLEARIQKMQSQLLGFGHSIEDTQAFREKLEQEQKRIRQEFEQRVQELERERVSVEQDKAQIDRYNTVLLKQRDIMIALTTRLNERDETIKELQEKLSVYEKELRDAEDEKDKKQHELMKLRRAAVQHSEGSLDQSPALRDALGAWARPPENEQSESPSNASAHKSEATNTSATHMDGTETIEANDASRKPNGSLDDSAKHLMTLAGSGDEAAFRRALDNYWDGSDSLRRSSAFEKHLQHIRAQQESVRQSLSNELETKRKEASNLEQENNNLKNEVEELRAMLKQKHDAEAANWSGNENNSVGVEVLSFRERTALREVLEGKVQSIVQDVKQSLASEQFESAANLADKLDTVCARTISFLAPPEQHNRLENGDAH